MQLQTDGGVLDRCEWTRDGQILTVSCDSGVVFNFLASLPVLTATHGTRCAPQLLVRSFVSLGPIFLRLQIYVPYLPPRAFNI